MTAQHYAEVEKYDDGGGAFVRFVCTGTDEDICHQWCAQDCEETCLARDVVLWPAKVEPGGVPDDIHQWAPSPRVGGSSCREMDWLDAVGWQDTGWVDEPDKGGDREVTVEDLRPGRHLIEMEWTGDDYIWRYPVAVPNV
jgi:hypothetical protein